VPSWLDVLKSIYFTLFFQDTYRFLRFPKCLVNFRTCTHANRWCLVNFRTCTHSNIKNTLSLLNNMICPVPRTCVLILWNRLPTFWALWSSPHHGPSAHVVQGAVVVGGARGPAVTARHSQSARVHTDLRKKNVFPPKILVEPALFGFG